MIDNLNVAYSNIVTARTPEDIFGKLKARDIKGQEAELKKLYHYFARIVHPDAYSGDSKAGYMAEEAFKHLISHYESALERVKNQVYGVDYTARAPHGAGEMTFSVGSREYRIFSHVVEGDFCQVYFGEMSDNGTLEKICLKVPRDNKDNGLLVTESQILRSIQHKSLPVLLDSFEMKDRRRANVLRQVEDSYDLQTLRGYFPRGLPQEHAVWVLDRLLSVLGFLHINLVIHGSIEPGNILVTPHNHNGFLIDFLLAVPEANQASAKYVAVNDYSAPEILQGAKPHPASDMYSLGKSMLYLLGGDAANKSFPSGVDNRIVSFLESFLREDPYERVSNAWESWHELKDLRTKVFGAPSQFLELRIGGDKHGRR